ncbi:hypothetical protein N9605_03000 [Flavobacteriaceae bacterium]|nr:hypothetical protein [Flavobacteriaceae bacterium]
MFTQLSKTNDSIIFNINNEKYYIGFYNDVYLIQNDSLIRVDKSIDSRVTINSYIFELNDTIIKYGGYGFWSQRNFMYYFDNSSFEWEFYKTISNDPIQGSFSGFQNYNEESIIFYGGKKVNTKNRLQQIRSEEIVEFNFETRELNHIGDLEINFESKELFYSNEEYSVFYDQEFVYKVNPFSNKVFKHYKPPVINSLLDVGYSSEKKSFVIKKTLNKTREIETILLSDNFLIQPIESFSLYNKPFNSNLIYILLTLMLVYSFVLYRMKKNETFIEPRSIKHKGSLYDFKIEDIKLLKLVIIDDEINFNSVLDIYSNSDLSYGHNTRITNEKLERLTIRLKSIFKLKNEPIIKNKSKVDKRQKVISLSDEFRSVSKNIKIKP